MDNRVIRAALRSGKGRVRGNNEDDYYFNGRFAPLERMDEEISLAESFPAEGLLFAVCDGMGGHANGEAASHAAVSRMDRLRERLCTTDFPTAVAEWVRETNGEVRALAGGGGCTAALVWIAGGRAHIAHIGDSRVYRFHGGRLVRLTRDHSRMQIMIDAGMITEEEARTHPQRHVITRFLGMDESEGGRCAATVIDPVPLVGRDRYMICSDGVTDMLTDGEISGDLAECKDFDTCAENIYQKALRAGGRDNTTLIVLDLDWDGEDETRTEEERGTASGAEDEDDPLERTLPPALKADAGERFPLFTVEQEYTIRQQDGRRFTIRSEIRGKWR